MEVMYTPEYFVFKRGDDSLWLSRKPEMKSILKKGIDFNQVPGLVCLGLAHGILGKFDQNYIILIRQTQYVGTIPGVKGREDEVYRIKRVAIIQLTDSTDPISNEIGLEPCIIHKSHAASDDSPYTVGAAATPPSSAPGLTTSNSGGTVQKTWNSIKNATSHVKSNQSSSSKLARPHLASNPKDRSDRRLLHEVIKMFNNSESFYFSPTGDLSNSIQRQHSNIGKQFSHPWDVFDKRFIWNQYMMDSLLSSCENLKQLNDLNFWITPVIQGFYQIGRCFLDSEKLDDGSELESREYQMILISRRSRLRAGTRYQRRGLDENGNCANYVETEQIFKYGNHVVSFVQVRGSVPIFWSQPGHAYRPPPRIDRSPQETQEAFEAHFKKEFSIYDKEVIVSLIERWGREKVVGEAYLNHVVSLDSPNLVYVSFDFHERCRGMRFENVSILIDKLRDIIRDMKYCWVDDQGVIQLQEGVFRVNCIDCLDRTNIVQTAIARAVMDLQFPKLGVLCPESELPSNCKRMFQIMWANNGDSISRQYAGTNALKGDYTRTGERRFSGMVKDSYNSASRYLQNRFKDAYRQAAIDCMQGNPINTAELSSPDSENVYSEDFDDMEHHERVKQVIEDCKKILIPEYEVILGGWPLIDADPMTGSPSNSSVEMDIVLVLTKDCYYVAEYDDQTDRITKYQKVLLEDLEKIELGPEPGGQLLFSHLTKTAKTSYCIRFHYLVNGQSGYFHMFRPTSTRFFNNMAIPVQTQQDAIDSLKAIYESFKVALSVKYLNVPFYEGRLEKRKSKAAIFSERQDHTFGSSKSRRHDRLFHGAKSSLIPRNISDGNLLNLKSVGSRALNNVSSQLARFKGKFTSSSQSNPHLHLHTVTEQQAESLSQPDGSKINSSEEEIDQDHDWEQDDAISEDESTRKSVKGKPHRNDQSIASNTSSVFLTERTLSSDYECSDFEGDEGPESLYEGPQSLPFLSNANLSLSGNDTLLESCGILTISPPLKFDFESAGIDASGNRTSEKPILQDVDDFVIDVMKKANLRQLHRKASGSLTCIPMKGKYSSGPSRTPLASSFTNVSEAPEIQIQVPDCAHGGSSPSSPEPRARKLSRSSEDIEFSLDIMGKQLGNSNSASCATLQTDSVMDMATSDHHNKKIGSLQVNLGRMKNSHSEMIIGQEGSMNESIPVGGIPPNCVTSPIVMKKDLILSPISRIARGVQSFGIQLRSHYSSEQNSSPSSYDLSQISGACTNTHIIFI